MTALHHIKSLACRGNVRPAPCRIRNKHNREGQLWLSTDPLSHCFSKESLRFLESTLSFAISCYNCQKNPVRMYLHLFMHQNTEVGQVKKIDIVCDRARI